MNIEIPQSYILDAVKEDIENFIQPLSKIFIETGWADTIINILVEQDINEEDTTCIKELLGDSE